MKYIVVLVDKETPDMRGIETDTLKISYHGVCTQMCGLRFKHTRPTHVINGISEGLKDKRYYKWYAHEVQPMLNYIKRKGGE
jgi:hypothetical protein